MFFQSNVGIHSPTDVLDLVGYPVNSPQSPVVVTIVMD